MGFLWTGSTGREREASMDAVVILNMKAGSLASRKIREQKEAVRKAFRAVGVSPNIMVAEGRNLVEWLHTAVRMKPDVVVVGGGDGSLSTAAGVLAASDMVLGVLPLGTYNHFAKDLGVPLQLEDAVRTTIEGVERRVDLGELNGRMFINASAIGVYAEFVKIRNPRRVRVGLARWMTLLYGFSSAFLSFPRLHVSLEAEERIIERDTSFLFVGNNEYDRGLFSSAGGRSAMDKGYLSLYIARCPDRVCMTRFALRVLTGRIEQYRDVEMMLVKEVAIETRGSRYLLVTTDGEVRSMRAPIRYTIRPGALRVMASRSSS